MTGSPPQSTHEISYVLLAQGQHFLVLKPLSGTEDEVAVRIDEILADHLIGVQDVELRSID